MVHGPMSLYLKNYPSLILSNVLNTISYLLFIEVILKLFIKIFELFINYFVYKGQVLGPFI